MTRVDIVGAGVAGLALAATLRRPQWQVTVHDPRWDVPDVGTAFGIWPSAMAALDTIGLADDVRTSGVRCPTAVIRDASGSPLKRLSGQDVWLVSRPDLVGILRAAVPVDVRCGRGRIDDPTALESDLVVGADGVHSVVRRHVWGGRSMPRPPRVTVLRGVAPAIAGVDGLQEWWGTAAHVGCTPNPDGTTNWFASFPRLPALSASSDVEESLAHARAITSTFAALPRAVVESATPGATLVHDVRTSRRLLSVRRDRYVLVGDAAHAMAPNLGRGACESIRDAVALGTLLNAHEPADAVSLHRRLVGPQAIAMAASAVMRLTMCESGAGVRDRVLRSIP